MHPQADQVDFRGDKFRARCADALENFANVTQVESVMGLYRDWSQLFLYSIVHELSGIDNLNNAVFDIICEYAEELAHDLVKDHLN